MRQSSCKLLSVPEGLDTYEFLDGGLGRGVLRQDHEDASDSLCPESSADGGVDSETAREAV